MENLDPSRMMQHYGYGGMDPATAAAVAAGMHHHGHMQQQQQQQQQHLQQQHQQSDHDGAGPSANSGTPFSAVVNFTAVT